MKPFYRTILTVAIFLAGAGCSAVRAGYESAAYTVVRKDGRFEIRDYPALTIVETPMVKDGADGSFGRLFGFISGRNEGQQKISMTTPVFMADGGANRTMAFVMPAGMKADAVPRPADGSLVVRELPAGRFAVMRFSGWRSDRREGEVLDELRKWMAGQGLASTASPVYGYFDPPWTPPFMRRNEVMLRIE